MSDLQYSGKVVEAGERFAHVFALNRNPKTNYKDGLLRCIISRSGEVDVGGYIDRSEFYKVEGDKLTKAIITEKLVIKNQDKIVKKLLLKSYDFLGLEDPDIWYDDQTSLLHVYFTMPFIGKRRSRIYLGHAEGKDLDNLMMTMPVLMAQTKGKFNGAKEVAIAPANSSGVRLNLVEVGISEKNAAYSAIRVAKAKIMKEEWEFGKVLFHPKEHKIKWAGEHASPGPFIPKEFIDIGEGKIVGFMNGREASKKVGKKKKYGKFSVGLYIYDYEKGNIDWVTPKRYLFDSDSKTITFASQFIQKNKSEGILYAHVDDSFVRAYKIRKADIVSRLPSSY